MKIINKILGSAIAALAAIMVFACCWQVITRFLLKDPSQWTEEFLRYALIWMTMLGAPYAYGKGQISPALQLPMQIYYVCIPICGCLMVLYCIERLGKWIKELKEGK